MAETSERNGEALADRPAEVEKNAWIGEQLAVASVTTRSAMAELSAKADQNQISIQDLNAKFERLWLHLDFLRASVR